MAQLPEDIIDRLTAMERRIQQLSTAVNTRPALNKIAGGAVEITDGGSLAVLPPDDGPAVFAVGAWSGAEYGVAMRRQTGQLAMSIFNGDGTSTSSQPIRIYDVSEHEIVSDDIVTGGLARPWLAMLPPQDTDVARWPQTTSTAWTTIARSFNVVWQPRMRLFLPTTMSSGTAGQVQVLVGGAVWGNVVAAGQTFDYTGTVAAEFDTAFAGLLTVEVQARVTSGSGSVYAQPQMMYGTQS
jgi:hypothetical protein